MLKDELSIPSTTMLNLYRQINSHEAKIIIYSIFSSDGTGNRNRVTTI